MLTVEGLARTYGDVRALDGVTFAVPSGSVMMERRPVDWSGRRRFGSLPHARPGTPTMRVIEQLCYPGELRGLSRGEVREEAERWLADLGLSDRARDALEDLSLGNRSGCSS